MRVLHAVHGFASEFRGGVEAYVAAVAAGQRARGDEAAVLAGSDREAREARLVEEEVEGVPVFRLTGLAPHTERLRDRPDGDALVAQLLRKTRPEVVHVHSWLRLVPDLVAVASAEGIPSVATLHDLGLSCPRVHRLKVDLSFCREPESPALCMPCARRDPWESDEEVLEELALRALFLGRERALLAKVTVPSASQRRLLEELGGFPPGTIEVLPVALPGLPTSVAPPAARGGGLEIGHWGNLLPAKGTHVLVAAAASLPESLGVRLHLFGTTSDASFDASLRAAAPPGRVLFHGSYAPHDLPLQPLHAAAFPSLAHESHSFALDEAFGLGLPVVVSDAGALPERAGGRGLVVKAGDVEELANALRRLVEEPDLLARLRSSPPGESPVPFEEHLARLDALYRDARLPSAAELSPSPSLPQRLSSLQRRASRRLADASAAREALELLRVEATAVVEARDVELRRLYETESTLRAETAALVEKLERAAQDLDAERNATGATRGQVEALLARRSVRLALRLARFFRPG